jgi:membrane-bound lytic murein transglycosylase D
MQAVLLWAAVLAGPVAVAATDSVPRPAELERDVQFWIRVYTEVTTNEGLLHDEHNLGVVYQAVHFGPEATPAQRSAQLDGLRSHYHATLQRLLEGATDLTADEQRIRAAFGNEASPARFAQALGEMRFQLGQADRFREGIVRSGTWEAHIAETLANLGLPPEISALPHVESSFNPAAYSKVGAAGLWQFMRSTGRRYLRIDDAVDERMDPFRATEAAAQLLDFNYRLLGTWPLALTAYNHGAAGMRRARDSMGTSDVVRIVRQYKSPTFGFASRNFYVSFLAALEIDRNPEKYFGAIDRRPVSRFREVEMPAYVSMSALERVVKVDRTRLEALNPALRPPVWKGQRRVPKGYRLRLPTEAGEWSSAQLAAKLAPGERFASQARPSFYKVKAGETLAGIASAQGFTPVALAEANGLKLTAKLKTGRSLQLPENAPPGDASDTTRQVLSDKQAETRAAASADQRGASRNEPLSAAQAESQSPALIPGAASPQASDPVDYAVGGDDSVRVAADETLGHFADWLAQGGARLRELNDMKASAAVVMGRKLKLDFSKVARADFEQKRRDYHQQLQARFFAGHRIVGTEVYVSRNGDSLWAVTQRYARLPVWLLQQYNPDLDFSSLRAGMKIVVPRIEDLPAV